jgi:co-chaperonin GroES (HSP10)
MCKCTPEHKQKTIPIVEKYSIPFKCKDCGAIYFPLSMRRDLVVVWVPKEVKENKLSSVIIIPEKIIDENLKKNKTGIILDAGPGYYDKNGRFIENPFKSGDVVSYNNQTPWRLPVVDSLGQEHSLPYFNFGDVFGWLTED